MTDTLLPCPFCGRDAEFERIGDARQSTIIACTDCGARYEDGSTFNHAAGWNHRHPDRTPANTPDDLREVVARVIGALDNILALAVNNYDQTGDGNWGNIEGFANSGLRALSAITPREAAAFEAGRVRWW